MNICQKERIFFFFNHAITILSLFTYYVCDDKVKIYNRAKELYCNATIFVFLFSIVYLPKKNGNWKMAQGCRLSPIALKNFTVVLLVRKLIGDAASSIYQCLVASCASVLKLKCLRPTTRELILGHQVFSCMQERPMCRLGLRSKMKHRRITGLACLATRDHGWFFIPSSCIGENQMRVAS